MRLPTASGFPWLALFLLPAAAHGGDWPQWRGPTGQGLSDEKDLPLKWDAKTGENVEKESGLRGRLLRPLCAKRLHPTEAELAGMVDREKLLDLSGRNRKPQFELARRFGITDYASPAGGCLFTDVRISRTASRARS